MIVWAALWGCYNILALVVMKWDKECAKHHRWRVPEKVLFFLALSGGSVGILWAMHQWHHKNRKKRFRYGIPMILLLQIGIISSFIKII